VIARVWCVLVLVCVYMFAFFCLSSFPTPSPRSLPCIQCAAARAHAQHCRRLGECVCVCVCVCVCLCLCLIFTLFGPVSIALVDSSFFFTRPSPPRLSSAGSAVNTLQRRIYRLVSHVTPLRIVTRHTVGSPSRPTLGPKTAWARASSGLSTLGWWLLHACACWCCCCLLCARVTLCLQLHDADHLPSRWNRKNGRCRR